MMTGTDTIKQQAAGAGATGAGQAKAALQVFVGGACYGAMATTYKLAYAAGFTSAQVVASQAWFGCLFFALATLASHALGHRWQLCFVNLSFHKTAPVRFTRQREDSSRTSVGLAPILSSPTTPRA